MTGISSYNGQLTHVYLLRKEKRRKIVLSFVFNMVFPTSLLLPNFWDNIHYHLRVMCNVKHLFGKICYKSSFTNGVREREIWWSSHDKSSELSSLPKGEGKAKTEETRCPSFSEKKGNRKRHKSSLFVCSFPPPALLTGGASQKTWPSGRIKEQSQNCHCGSLQ